MTDLESQSCSFQHHVCDCRRPKLHMASRILIPAPKPKIYALLRCGLHVPLLQLKCAGIALMFVYSI